MKEDSVIEKFGLPYFVTPTTFKMGTHHIFAESIASRFAGCKKVLDACVGAGFNAIPIARVVGTVVAVDNNKEHLSLAKQNAELAKIGNIDFILGDIMDETIFEKIGNIDGAYLDPEWVKGGCVDNCNEHSSSLSHMEPPADMLFKKVETKTKNIALRLPRELAIKELDSLPPHELEMNYLDDKLKFYTLYFGDLAETIGNTEFRAYRDK